MNVAAFRPTYANLAKTSSNSNNLPNIFDILSEESLKSSLKAGIKNLIQLLSIWNPELTETIKKYFDEFYAMFMLLLENYYIKSYSASFSENFYGMKRVSLISNQDNSFVDLRDRLKSLICLVILPYISSKIEAAFNRFKKLLPNQRTKLTNLFLFIYPYLRMSFKGLCLLFKVLYALKYFNENLAPPASSPLLYFSDVFLALLTSEDIRKFESMPLSLQKSGIIAKLWRFGFSFLSILGRIFSYGIYLFQFLEYFYANDFAKQLNLLTESGEFQRPFAPPHPLEIPSENHVLKSLEHDKCPLCGQTRTNDTALSVSGYVFCYNCIYDYLNQESRCPITLIPANINQLIQIYKI